MTINDLYELAEKSCIEIDAFNMEKREAFSVKGDDGKCFVAVDPRRIKSRADERVKIAHEIGHCETESFYTFITPFESRQKQENRADIWAIKRLISEDELNAAVSDGYIEVWQLAEYFDVTESFMKKAISLYKYGNLYSV